MLLMSPNKITRVIRLQSIVTRKPSNANFIDFGQSADSLGHALCSPMALLAGYIMLSQSAPDLGHVLGSPMALKEMGLLCH